MPATKTKRPKPRKPPAVIPVTELPGDLWDATDIALAEKDLRTYVELAYPIVEPGQPFIPNWHIDAICDHLSGVYPHWNIRKLVINIPPRHMKSLLVAVFWMTWSWISRPAIRWLFSSYAMSLSIRDSVKSRRIIESPWYQRWWGERYQLTSDQNQKIKFENDKTGYRLATSVDGANTGEGADILVVDDPHNVKEAHSEKKREETIQWWSEVMSTRLNNPNQSARVIIMQRVHNADLTAHVLKQDGWLHLNLPSEYVPKNRCITNWMTRGKVHGRTEQRHFEDPRLRDSELLWVSRFDREYLDGQKLELGPYGYAAQHQQNPSTEAGAILKREWWKLFKHPPVEFDLIIMSWDMAFKDLQDSSYVVGAVWGKKGADRYLLDLTRDQIDFVESLKRIKLMHAKWPQAIPVVIEGKANGPAIISMLQNEIPGILEWPPKGQRMDSKEARAYSAQPYLNAGNCWLPEDAPWALDFIEECAAFPFGDYDDQVDTFTQAMDYFRWMETQPRSEVGGITVIQRQKPLERRELRRQNFERMTPQQAIELGIDPRAL